MKTLFFGTAILLCLAAQPAGAAPILAANFCPGNASCPAGLEEASLVFSEDLSTALDLNDYLLDVTFDGGATGPLYLDMWSFTIAGVQTPSGYEVKPTVLSFSDGSGWLMYYDNVNNGSSCTANPGSSQEVCANGTTTASLLNNEVTFQLSVDLAGDGSGGDDFLLASNSNVNLRARFVDADGKKVGAILSPSSIRVDFPREITEVPEPTSLFLLGSGLVAIAGRVRKRLKG
jgi:hypothetical protein